MTHLDQVREHLAKYMATPASYPIIQANTPEMMNLLIRRAFVAKDRRFHPEPTPITNFGHLE